VVQKKIRMGSGDTDGFRTKKAKHCKHLAPTKSLTDIMS
jgi:hypothetical protein